MSQGPYCILESQKEEEEGRAEKVHKGIMVEDFPNLLRGVNILIQETKQHFENH